MYRLTANYSRLCIAHKSFFTKLFLNCCISVIESNLNQYIHIISWSCIPKKGGLHTTLQLHLQQTLLHFQIAERMVYCFYPGNILALVHKIYFFSSCNASFNSLVLPTLTISILASSLYKSSSCSIASVTDLNRGWTARPFTEPSASGHT
jgi:hypothetical protein